MARRTAFDELLGNGRAARPGLEALAGWRKDTAGPRTTAVEAFEAGHGVSQDYVRIFYSVAPLLGIPARYVPGHLFRRDGAGVQPATHAWAEAWDADLGWIGYDPANGICPDEAYVRVACGLDYRGAAPFSGTVAGGGRQEMEVRVEVREAASSRCSSSRDRAGPARCGSLRGWNNLRCRASPLLALLPAHGKSLPPLSI